jgi:hypothetical protein
MVFGDLFIDVLPLRAIIFQFLFLVIAIAIETIILHRYLEIDNKTSVQYAATVNLLSTFIGWLIFFNVLPLLPQGLKTQLITFVFFEQFFQNNWFVGVFPIVITTSLAIFLGTFIIKVKGLDLLDYLLGKTPSTPTVEEQTVRFRGRANQVVGFRANSRTYAVFVANALSFSAILLLLFVRYIEQTYLFSQEL